MLDILKHNKEVITDLMKSQAVLTEHCKGKFFQLFRDIEKLASYGSCHKTLSHEQLFRILQNDNPDETLDKSVMAQTVANRTLSEIKTSLSSITDELRNDPLLEIHEANRICAKIDGQVTVSLPTLLNIPPAFDEIAVLAVKGKESVKWVIIEKRKLSGARNYIQNFAQFSMLLSIFNTCVSGLIQDCDNSSIETIMNSTYYQKVNEISQCEDHALVRFRNHIEEISRGSGQMNKIYFREGLLRFLRELQQQASEITSVDRGSLETEMKFLKIVELQQKLSIQMLTIKNLDVEDICGACTEIIRELEDSNQTWKRLVKYFSDKTMLEFLRTPADQQNLLDQICNFLKYFKRDKKHKREELLMFWQEVRESVRKVTEKFPNAGQSNSTSSILYLYCQEYNEVVSDVSSIAENYFTAINKTIIRWDIVININNIIAEGVSSAHENLTHTEFERFSENLKTLVSTTTSGRIANERTSNLFEEMSIILKSNDCTESLRQMFSLFYAVLQRLLHDFLKDDKSDLSHTTNFFQRITDISAHMMMHFIETEVPPRAQVCLMVAKIKMALETLSVGSLEQETEMKWKRLQAFQKAITDAITDGENTQYIPIYTLDFRAKGENLQTVVAIWNNFEKDFQNIPEIKQCSPTVDHSIENTNLFQQETEIYICERFETTCDYLTIVEVPKDFFNEIETVVKEYGGKAVPEPTKKLRLLETLETERTNLTESQKLPNRGMRIPDCFKDFAAIVDKDDALKRQDWVSILKAISKLKNIMSTCTKNEQTRIEEDETEKIYVNAPLVDDANQKEETHFCCLRYQLRDFLLGFEKEKNGGQKLKTIEIPLQCLLRNLHILIKRLNKASAEKKVLSNIFAERETAESTPFNQLDKILNGFDGDGNILADGSAELRNKMKDTCDWENSYKAKYRLLNFWTNTERVVKKFFRKKAKNWKHMEKFRISIKEFKYLQKSIFDLACRNLDQHTCMDDCNIARCDPINYILQSRCVRPISLRRNRCLTIIVAFIVILFVFTVFVIMVTCSNVKNCIQWMST